MTAARRRTATRLPQDIGPIHFVGIGGIGMSGIAEVMLNLGYDVQGSDLADSDNVKRLCDLGARIMIGQNADNLAGAEVVVISSAIKKGNPELDAARAMGLPVVRRAEMLAELMRLRSNVAVAGTHGKTTTTSMIAALLDKGGVDPTVINGGIIHAYGSNARMGAGDWMVVEADESDGTFVKLPATIAVVTNIDPEHLDHYGSEEALYAAFDQFVSNLPFYGVAVCCIDHPNVQSLVGRIDDRRTLTYGFSLQADVCGANLRWEDGAARFDVFARLREGHRRIENLALPMPGAHNVANALAAVAVALELKLPDEAIREGLSKFEGVNRRFTRVGEWNGVQIIDDYGHHPVEIAAVLTAARQALSGTEGRVIAVHQPHRYSRMHTLFEDFCRCFNDAELVAIADVYAAGEAPIEGAGKDDLIAGLRARGHRRATALPTGDEAAVIDALADLVAAEARPGDMVVCLGAGSITRWARALPAALQARTPAGAGDV